MLPPFAISCALLLASVGGDWPQFLGPQRDDTAAAVPIADGAPPPTVRWRAPVGPGFGGAAVRDGRVYLLDREAGERDVLRVLDLEDGREVWRAADDAPGRLNYAGSRSVPVVTERLVLTVGGLGHVRAFDRAAESMRWRLHLEDDLDGRRPMFGFSASPVLVDGRLVVAPLGPDVGLVALDPATGETRWRTGGVGHGHATPAVVTLHGRQQLLHLSTEAKSSGRNAPAPTTLSSFDPRDGRLLWRYEATFCGLPIAPPTGIDDERIFLTGGYRAGSILLRVRRETDGEGVSVEEEFRLERGSQVHPPVRSGDHLYLLVNENWNHSRARRAEGGLLCLSLDGDERWRTGDDPYLGRGDLVRIGDRLVVQDGFDGSLRVVRANPERYEPIHHLPRSEEH
ncbi:MAG: PQQ-binding-like beta-propeller repeat protein, partial [Planctomycetota bacterium JB042]